MPRTFRLSVLSCVAIVCAVAPYRPIAAAQGAPRLPGTRIIDGLGAPRGIAFDAAGNLLIADAGVGGSTVLTLRTKAGPPSMKIGMSGSIVSVAPDGTSHDLMSGFPSYNTGKETGGLYRVVPRETSIWVMLSGSGPQSFGAFWGDSIVEIDAATLVTKTIINMNAIEAAADPDGRGYDSNASDFAWAPDGTMYITNAGQNSLLSWTSAGGLHVVRAWPDNPVPTAVEVAKNGDLYIGFLGTALTPGAARIEHWAGETLVETFSNLTAVTDILLDGDVLYAVELFTTDSQGKPGPGDVATVTKSGKVPVVAGLPAPFGLAKSSSGSLYVSYGTIPTVPGVTGGVVRLEKGAEGVASTATRPAAPAPHVAPAASPASRGERIFRDGVNGAPPCVTCHQAAGAGIALGPDLAGIGTRAASRVQGQNARHYLEESIMRPAAHVVPGYRDMMYPDYAKHFSAEDLADLVAFLLTQ